MVFNAKRFPSSTAPSKYSPMVSPLMTRRGERLKIGCSATAIPATPPRISACLHLCLDNLPIRAMIQCHIDIEFLSDTNHRQDIVRTMCVTF